MGHYSVTEYLINQGANYNSFTDQKYIQSFY